MGELPDMTGLLWVLGIACVVIGVLIASVVPELWALVKQAKREALRSATDRFYHLGASIVESRQVAVELMRMAEEIK